jgi:metallophosphoesterase (TIGR00282 family)
MKIICFGDVVGDRGSNALLNHLHEFKEEHRPDVIIVNAENSNSNGKGPSVAFVKELFIRGVDVITGGNHSFNNKYASHLYEELPHLLRPINFPSGTAGNGCCYIKKHGGSQLIGVINIQLRTFMRELLSCPFRTIDSILNIMKEKTDIIIIDVHGEATSEKISFGSYVDGRASVVFGTHTHVQTADNRIFPKGTGYITDVGMCGVLHSSLGVSFNSVIKQMLTQLPVKFELEAEGDVMLCGIVAEVDDKTGKTISIERIAKVVS